MCFMVDFSINCDVLPLSGILSIVYGQSDRTEVHQPMD
jgi:hypothetical protein